MRRPRRESGIANRQAKPPTAARNEDSPPDQRRKMLRRYTSENRDVRPERELAPQSPASRLEWEFATIDRAGAGPANWRSAFTTGNPMVLANQQSAFGTTECCERDSGIRGTGRVGIDTGIHCVRSRKNGAVTNVGISDNRSGRNRRANNAVLARDNGVLRRAFGTCDNRLGSNGASDLPSRRDKGVLQADLWDS